MQTKQRLDVPLSLKSVSDSGEFEGYGSVFGVKDSHDDVVMSGAFAASLRAWSDRKALPALLWQHRMDEPIGVYTEMKEDDVGLYVRGRLLIDDDPLAKRAHAHMKAGSLTGLSIGYVLKDWEYDRSKEAFLLKEIDLWEVSLVTFPSNDEARISDVKNALARGEICGDSVYRVKRQRDLNGARRFLLLECTELGECRQSHGGSNGDSLFSR